MTQINSSIKNTLMEFLMKIKEENIEITGAFLFGSYAKNSENKWSDIDVAIISPAFSDDRFEERVRLLMISHKIDSRIEPVPFRPEWFVDEDPLAWEIKKYGIPISFQ